MANRFLMGAGAVYCAGYVALTLRSGQFDDPDSAATFSWDENPIRFSFSIFAHSAAGVVLTWLTLGLDIDDLVRAWRVASVALR